MRIRNFFLESGSGSAESDPFLITCLMICLFCFCCFLFKAVKIFFNRYYCSPLKLGILLRFSSVLRIRIRLDPFQFGQPDPDRFHEMVLGSKKSAKLRKMSTKINQNHKNIIYLKNIYQADINIYTINYKTDHFWRYIFAIEKKVY